MLTREKKPGGRTHLTAAVPGALTAVLLVGAVAFGATTLRSAAPATSPAADAADAADATGPADEPIAPAFGAQVAAERKHALEPDPAPADPTPKPQPPATPKPQQAEAPEPHPDATPKPQATEVVKPKPAATPKPATGPATPTVLALEGWPKDGKVKLGWSAYGGAGFEYYKLVRSTDATVTWPAGAGDTVIGVVSDPKATWWADKAPCGVPSSYRVFAVRAGDGGYVTLAASNVVTLVPTCPPPPPMPSACAMALTVAALPGQGVTLSWTACTSDGFVAYKVVRSAVHGDPRYPLNEGSEGIAAIGDRSQVTLLDTKVSAGETWTYRVVAVASGPDGKVIVGETAAVAVTAP